MFFLTRGSRLSTFYLCFRFSLWKLGLINWLDVTPWSATWLGWKGIRGFFIDMLATSKILLLLLPGEPCFDFNCLGNSSLSSILVVFISSCLLLSGKDKSITDWSDLGLVGECLTGISLTTSRSHSSAIEVVFLCSSAVWSSCDISSYTTMTPTDEIGCAFTLVESGLVGFGSDVASFRLGATHLEYSWHQWNKISEYSTFGHSPFNITQCSIVIPNFSVFLLTKCPTHFETKIQMNTPHTFIRYSTRSG